MSSGKRDPGFAPIRRGLLEHLPTMSSNAVKFYLFLHLNAQWQPGPNRGTVRASFEDMASANGWSLKILRGAIEELEAKSFITVERASNQHELTSVAISKFDRADVAPSLQGSSSGFATSLAPSSAPSMEGSSEGRTKPAIAQSQQDLSSPKNVKEVKQERTAVADGVRRPLDAERLTATEPFSHKEKKQKLDKNLAAKIRRDGDLYSDWIAKQRARGEPHPFGDAERVAFAATRYTPDLASPVLGWDFVATVVDVYEETREKNTSPGNLCSKIIDRCETERKKGGGGYYYPPDFVDHRDRLRAQERAQEQAQTKSPSVRVSA